MPLDVSLKLAHANDASIGRVRAGFEDETGKMQDGRIKLNGKIYEVKFLEGGTAEVRRNYQGLFANFRNKYCHKDTKHALALQAKVNEVLKQSETKEYKMISGTHQKLLGLLRSGGGAAIEVADYGFESNRTIISDSGLIQAMNSKLEETGQMIKFNRIDDYNTIVGIDPGTVDPRNLPEMLKSIADGTLQTKIKKQFADNFDRNDVRQWKEFLAKPENFAKIDILGKLHRYMHLPEGHQASKQTGWEASFARDRNAAMRSFVLKNLPYDAKDISTDTVNLLAAKLTEYVEICATKDDGERNRKLGEFFAKANWLTPEEQVKFDNLVSQSGKGVAEEVLDKKTLGERKLFNLFSNVVSVAFFRETSKIGLDFFRRRGTPVMFQFSDYSGRSYVGREQELFQPEGWRDGEDAQGFRENGGSSITSSEMRHALRMGENTTVHFVGGMA